MSVRTAPSRAQLQSATAQALRDEVEQLRAATVASQRGLPWGKEAVVDRAEALAAFEALSETEKSAATIGASPHEFAPIAWINQAHYGELLRKNVLSGRLTQQIEAYKVVAERG